MAPDFAGEVRSPGTVAFDLGRKKQIYEQSGVQEYWFVDTPAEVVIVFRRAATDGAVFDDGVEIDVDSPLTSPLFDGLSLALSELFAP